MLNEKTKVSLSIVNFLLLFGFIITAVYTSATWSAEIENNVQNNTDKIEAEIIERKLSDDKIVEEINKNNIVMAEIQSSQSDIRTGQARIETDLKWIINALKVDSQ